MTNSQSYYIPGIIRVPESWRGVVSQVAEVYGIPPEQIMAKDRKQPGAEARFISMWFIRHLFNVSNTHVADLFGRYYTASLHANSFIEKTIRTDKRLRSRFSEIAYRFGYSEPHVKEMLNID